MWKISRNLIFPRWPLNNQKFVENNSKPCTSSKSSATFASDEKKRYSDSDQKKKHHFKQSERFWNCEKMRFLLFKSAILEKAGWLGTVTILCFNFHFKSLASLNEHERGRSLCLLSRNVIAMPQTADKQEKALKSSESKVFSNYEDSKDAEVTAEINALDKLREISAQYAAAVHNSSGLSHLERNAKKAFRHFQEGARLGSSQAFYNLGLCYELGKGTKVNLTRAAFCYRKAAMKGHGLASFNLAVYFLKGIGGLPVDPEIAKLLISEAAEKEVPEAQLYIGIDCLENKKWSEAFQQFDSLAKNNVPDGKYYLGLCYENGWGVEKDVKVATEIFSQTAKSGHSKSVLKLSKCYEEGLGGCNRDLDFSTALCQMIADQGDEEGKSSVLRLKLKKATMSDEESFNKNFPFVKMGKIIQNSSSVPELASYQNTKSKTGPEALVAHSYLGLITTFLPAKTDNIIPKKNMFYIGEEDSDAKYTSAFMSHHVQMSGPQLMTAKS